MTMARLVLEGGVHKYGDVSAHCSNANGNN